jgi:hypothetical protein
MTRKAALLLFGLGLACSGRAELYTPGDPCTPDGAFLLGPEVPYEWFTPPPGCTPLLLKEYENPSGAIGQKIYVIRSDEKFGQEYICEKEIPPSGIDFQEQRLLLLYWEHQGIQPHQLRAVRDDGASVSLVYDVGECPKKSKKFTLDTEELLIPNSKRPPRIYRCPADPSFCNNSPTSE